MGRVPDLRQLKKEDFDKDDQSLIERLEFPINNFMQQVINVLKGGIDFNNLNRNIVTVTLSTNASGTPVSTVQFKNTLNTKVIGMNVISCINKSSVQRFPIAAPFVSYTSNGDLITVTNVAGLGIPEGNTNSDSFQLTIELIGANLPIS